MASCGRAPQQAERGPSMAEARREREGARGWAWGEAPEEARTGPGDTGQAEDRRA